MKIFTSIVFSFFLMISFLAFGENDIDQAKGLSIGSKAPLFEAIDGNNNNIILADFLKKGTTVIFFYRGAWCPYCSRHLSEFQESLPMLYEKGVSVIAITPEKPEYINEMTEKTGASFTIVYDKDYSIAKSYDVNFAPTQKQINFYNNIKNAKMDDAHNTEEPNLPIPATYIINKEGDIIWRHFDPNYKKRASVKDILEHLK